MAAIALFSPDPDDPGDAGGARMPLIEHLAELRRRLIVSAIALAVGAVVCFMLYQPILDVLIGPYEDVTGKTTLFITDPLEGFTTRVKIAAYAGFLLASPVVFWQVWRFITPGLHRREKRYAIPFIICSILLFVAGAAFALLTFERALSFLVSVGGENLETIFSPARYLGLIVLIMVAFGIAFELPVILVFLQLARVLSSQRLRAWRRWAIVVIVSLAAVITPSQDPYTLFAMAGPMYLLYEIAIVIGRLMKR